MNSPVRHYNLTPHTTFGLPCKAAYYTELHDEGSLNAICSLPEFDRNTVLWLGGGSNIVFAGDYHGLVVRLATKGIKLMAEDGDHVWVEAQAGEVWHDFVQYTLAQGWSGLENLSLIPGTVGASPVQNIGAYGVEVKDWIESVRCFDLDTMQFVVLGHDDCGFAYRDSLFKQAGKGRFVITAVRFRLNKHFSANTVYGDVAKILQQQGGEITAQAVADAVCRIRRSKLPDPKILGNVGSFYKNPIVDAAVAERLLRDYPNMPHYPQTGGKVKLAAGWLIDQCSLKGHRIGGAAVHDKQALVLVNCGHAVAADVRALSDFVCSQVLQRFGVALDCEPSWLPENV